MIKQAKNKGITLIALVITIIILLILAGVSISALTEKGLLRQAIETREKAKISEYLQAINLAKTEGVMTDYYPNSTQESILNRIKNILNQQELFEGSNYKIKNNTLTIITSDGYVFEVTVDEARNVEIKYISKSDEIDKTEPTMNINFSANTITTKGFTLNIEVIDSDYEIEKIIWYYKKSTANSYINEEIVYTESNEEIAGDETTKNYTVDNLESGTYNAYAEIYDVEGNVITSEKIDITLAIITTTDYNGVYDGNAHKATISSSIENTIFTYGEQEGSYTLDTMPSYTNAGTYTVYWKASKDYTIATGSVTVKIEKADSTISITAKDGYITVTTNSNGTVSATSSDTNISNVTVSDKSIRIVPVTNGSAGTFTVTVKVNEADNYKESESVTQSVTVSSKYITSSIGWYTGGSYWSGCYYLDTTDNAVKWMTDTNSMWRTTANIELTAGCYYVIGPTGGSPRAVLWNDENRSEYSKAFSATNGETIVVTGTKYLQIPILVSGYTGTTPINYTSYDVRMITFN